MIKKVFQRTIEQLLSLNTSLWIQIGGMTASISLGVLLFNTVQFIHSKGIFALLIVIEILIVLLSISTFSIYLTKKASSVAEKLGIRKTLGASGWKLFMETSVQTTFLILLSILFSIAVIDVSMPFAGLNFEIALNNVGVLQYGLVLLTIFLLSIATLFIIQSFALAPNIKNDFDDTAFFERLWFNKLTKILNKLTILFGLLTGLLLIMLFLILNIEIGLPILSLLFYAIIGLWRSYNNRTA